jgi:hypothetical protein
MLFDDKSCLKIVMFSSYKFFVSKPFFTTVFPKLFNPIGPLIAGKIIE